MKTAILSVALIFILFNICPAQTVAGKEIRNRDIEWSDFVGSVDSLSIRFARTNWNITYTYGTPTFSGSALRVRAVVHVFLADDSWVKPEKESARLLSHERGHFKTARICGREIQSKINSTSFSSNYAREIGAIFQRTLAKYQAFERQYDSETDYYQNEAQQDAWNKRLDSMLK